MAGKWSLITSELWTHLHIVFEYCILEFLKFQSKIFQCCKVVFISVVFGGHCEWKQRNSLLISDFAATLWYNSSKVKSFPIYWSKDPVCLTSGFFMQKDMEAVHAFIWVNKCLIVSHYLLIPDSRIAIQVRQFICN